MIKVIVMSISFVDVELVEKIITSAAAFEISLSVNKSLSYPPCSLLRSVPEVR